MKTQIESLENKINNLLVRLNNAQESLKENPTNDFNSLRDELQKLITEFNLMKIKFTDENSEESKITEEDIEEIIRLIDDYITDFGKSKFRSKSFGSTLIEEVELSVNYSDEINLDEVKINIEDYFCSNFSFEYDEFVENISNSKNEGNIALIKQFLNQELFELIQEIIDKSISDMETIISFGQVEDFDCELTYSKKIEVSDVTIFRSDFEEAFDRDFDFNRNDIEEIIKSYHNFQIENDSED